MSEVSRRNECPVCLDVIGEKNYTVTECGHTFHATCIFINMRMSSTSCPLCREELIPDLSFDDDVNANTHNNHGGDGGDEPERVTEWRDFVDEYELGTDDDDDIEGPTITALNNIDNTIDGLINILDRTYNDTNSHNTDGHNTDGHNTNNIALSLRNINQILYSN